MMNKIILFVFIICFISCSKDPEIKRETGFVTKVPSQIGIDFVNQTHYDREFNIYTYRNFYNGGGVAIGDINGDKLPDLYFTANMLPNRLYLNKGDWQFEDITTDAGVGGEKKWSTGSTFVDINGDGHLDIYVCNSGDVNGDNKGNELFINDGKGKFQESAAKYGLNDEGYSTHAAFFDYDRDGDLDMYLLNNSYQAIGSFNLKNNLRYERDSTGGDKLFRNDGNSFVDVSSEAGILGSVIGFGLGVTVGDINLDGWPDIYVSNDFFERDYIYINKKDGTFTEDLTNRMKSISAASMGADMADINNDCLPDIFVTEMLPGNDRRAKTKTTFENWDKYAYNLEYDYYHQFTRNMLQISRADHTYSEVGRQMGVEATDWSWGALIADFDNDSWKDLYIANGTAQDLTDLDFLNYVSDKDVMKSMIKNNKVDYKGLIDAIPSEKVSNYMYRNTSGISFDNVASDWGLGEPSFSNGSAYGDIDLDGDLDLIVNNANMPPFIYENINPSKNWIQLEFTGKEANTFAIGTKVYAYSGGIKQYHEFMPMKGFQSSMDYIIHIGLAENTLDSIHVVWPDQETSVYRDLEINKRHNLKWSKGNSSFDPYEKGDDNVLMLDVSDKVSLPFEHKESKFVDFDSERLLYHMRSTQGPKVYVADVNNDKKEDLVFASSSNNQPEIYFQTNSGFKNSNNTSLANRLAGEEFGISVFDIEGDGDQDIYLARGGNELSNTSSGIKDDLYTNRGNGRFEVSTDRFGANGFIANSCVKSGDFDNDGDIDLFVGEGVKPKNFGVPCSGYILENVNGKLKDVTSKKAKGLISVGMIRDAEWLDINNDKLLDLVVIGEYMSPRIFINNGNEFVDQTESFGLTELTGWWNTIESGDIDNDGDLDLVIGNHGTNSRFKATKEKPVLMHVNDFDRNRSVEQIICRYEGDQAYPLVLRQDIVMQLPHLKKRYLNYADYANQRMEDIFSEEEMKGMITLKAQHLQSVVLINDGNRFTVQDLPSEIQQSPVYAMKLIDVNNDGILDLLSGGNLYGVKPEAGRYDASRGSLLLGNGKGGFIENENSNGFEVDGEIRDIESISIGGKQHLIVTRNNQSTKIFKLQ